MDLGEQAADAVGDPGDLSGEVVEPDDDLQVRELVTQWGSLARGSMVDSGPRPTSLLTNRLVA